VIWTNPAAVALNELSTAPLMRIMGLLPVVLAMQYFVNGIKDLGLIFRH
jgi:small neutral amino acid transporter SnatA (MarC family)